MTGGIGCGKSTASKLFEAAGFGRLDCDALVHDLLARDAGTIEEVSRRFGKDALNEAGGVDRQRLGEKVFGDPDALKDLESMLHPRVREAWEGIAESDAAKDWVIEIPLLFEKNLENRVDFTVCVFCNDATQSVRLERRGISKAQAMARKSRQLPLTVKAEKADFVLLNDGSLPFLERQIEQLISLIQIS